MLYNFIFSGIILLSLAIIMVIFSRNVDKSEKASQLLEEEGENKKINFLSSMGHKARNGFLFIIEKTVQWFKHILRLIHLWVIKIKKGTGGDEDERFAQEEFFREEKKELEGIIKEDLPTEVEETVEIFSEEQTFSEDEISQTESFIKLKMKNRKEKEAQKKSILNKIKKEETAQRTETEKEEILLEKEELNEEKELAEKKKGIFQKIKFWGKQDKAEERQEEDNEIDYDEKVKIKSEVTDDFSDGIVSIKKSENNQVIEDKKLSMKDVKTSQEKQVTLNEDELLGIDHEIWEKKILKKIENEPKNFEHYRQLGELYLRKGNLSDAQEAYKFIIKNVPRDMDAKRKLQKIKLLKRLN